MRTLILDNNDSFTYNIAELLRQCGKVDFEVISSTSISITKIEEFDKIIISPGPGKPIEFPILKQLFDEYKHKKAILGICLGHQAICSYFGARLKRLDRVVHGQQVEVINSANGSSLFKNVPKLFDVGFISFLGG